MTYVTAHEVRFGDVDRFGHVNHLSLLEFFECARNPFFADLAVHEDLPNLVATAGFVIAHLDTTFHSAVDADAGEVEVSASVERVGNTSVTLRYELWHEGVLRVTCTTVLVFVTPDGKQS